MTNTPCSSSGTYWCFSILMGMILLGRAWAEEQGGWGWESPDSVCKCIWSGHWHSPSPPTDPWPAPPPSPHSLPLSVLQHHKTKGRFIFSIFLDYHQMIKGMINRNKLFRCTHGHAIHTLVCVSVPGWSLFQLVYVSSSPVIQRNVPVLFSLYKPSQNWSADRPNTRLLTNACSNLETRTYAPHKLLHNSSISGKSTTSWIQIQSMLLGLCPVPVINNDERGIVASAHSFCIIKG